MSTLPQLVPAHQEDLRRSAIPEDFIVASGIRSIGHAEGHEFGFRSAGSLDGMLIPYWDPREGRHSDRYARLKPTIATEEAKYLAPVGEPPRFYFAPGTTLADLFDSAVEIYFVEGEKKALSVLAWARRRGVPCIVIGLGGCYAWLKSVKGELPDGSIGKVGSDPIEDFDLVNWHARKVTICLDGDVTTNSRVASAEARLAKELRGRGAQVYVIRIPAGKDGQRRGADDLIAQEGDAAWESILAKAVPKHDSDSSVPDLLREAGLADLGDKPALEKVEVALTNLRNSLTRADPLRRALTREGAVEALSQAGIHSPAAVVDAALQIDRQTNTTDLQGTSLVLNDPVPWPEPVDGAELLDELASTFRRFLVLPEGGAEAMALWSIYAHAHQAWTVSPLLTFSSAAKRSGKTTAEELIGAAVPRPLSVSNITPAALFRTIEARVPTLLIDEVDSFLRDDDELRGVLNSGHRRSSAVIIRTVGDSFEPRCFSTWAPKVLALIGKLPGTLEDRSIVIPMRRRSPKEKVERLRLDRLSQFEPLRRRAARWAKDNLEALRQADPDVPAQLHDRAADNWRTLLAIADRCGGPWPPRARWAALILTGSSEEGDTTPGIQLLADLRDLFRSQGTDRLSSEQVTEALSSMEDRPWPEWRRGKPLTQNQLARLLKPFGIRPKGIRLEDGSTPRGYHLAELEDSFSRYLPSEVQQPQQVNNDRPSGDSEKCNTDPPVAPREFTEKPRQMGIVAPVALPTPPSPGDPQGALPLEPLSPQDWEEI